MHCDVHAAAQAPPEQTCGDGQAAGADQTPQPLASAAQLRTPLPSHEAAPTEQPVGQVGPLPPVPPMSSLPPPVPPPPPPLSTAMSPDCAPGRLMTGAQPTTRATKANGSARTRVMRRTYGRAREFLRRGRLCLLTDRSVVLWCAHDSRRRSAQEPIFRRAHEGAHRHRDRRRHRHRSRHRRRALAARRPRRHRLAQARAPRADGARAGGARRDRRPALRHPRARVGGAVRRRRPRALRRRRCPRQQRRRPVPHDRRAADAARLGSGRAQQLERHLLHDARGRRCAR